MIYTRNQVNGFRNYENLKHQICYKVFRIVKTMNSPPLVNVRLEPNRRTTILCELFAYF